MGHPVHDHPRRAVNQWLRRGIGSEGEGEWSMVVLLQLVCLVACPVGLRIVTA